MVTRAEISAAIDAHLVLPVLALIVTAGKERVEATHTGSVTACELFVLTHTEVAGATGALSVLTVLTGKVTACKLIVLATLTSRMSAGVKRVVKAVAKILAAALTE